MIGATVAAECVRERLDKERQGEAFVAKIHAAQGQDRSSLLTVENARIIGRMSITVNKPRPRQPFTGCGEPSA